MLYRLKMSERYTFAEIQTYVDEQIAFSEDRVRKQFEKMIEETKRDIRSSLNKTLDTKVQAAVETNMMDREVGGGQLIIPDATKKELAVSISKDVTKEVYGFINKEVLPRVEGAISYMNYVNQDGDELVNQYRRRVHDTVNKPGKDDAKLITGKVGKKSDAEKLADFQRSSLFFNADD